MPADRARALLGQRYHLWRNCGAVSRQTRIPFNYVWQAAIALIDVGRPPRDGDVISLAEQLRDGEQRHLEQITKRREARNERRRSEDQADQNG